MSQVLNCVNLTKTYGQICALNHVNLTLESGKIVGLLGPNGSGKTTLIKLINGLLTPSEGSIQVCGETPGVASKAQVAYLPDSIYLNSWMTVAQIVEYFQDFYEDFQPERAYEMLQRLGIDPKMKLKNLSKGNKEKVQLILVMSRRAQLYLLDEPIGGVDPAARDFILTTIIQNYDPSATILISTHLISDVEKVLDDYIFLQGGHVLRQGSVEEARAEAGKSLDEIFREVFQCLASS